MFIALEGSEGAGKSSALEMMREFVPSLTGIGPVLFTREPGGTPFSESLRDTLLTWEGEEIDPMAELLLVQSARVHHYNRLIAPRVNRGEHVITDRFFGSTIAYQGYGRQVTIETIEALIQLTLGMVHPDLTLYLDCPVITGFERKKANGDVMDRMEQETLGFYERVRKGFLHQSARYPGWKVIDATQSIVDVHADIRTHLVNVLLPES